MEQQQKREYVGVSFRWGKAGKTYTYHNDGPPVNVGDIVKVPASDGDGWNRALVVSISYRAPAFDTKPIIGRAEYNPPSAA